MFAYCSRRPFALYALEGQITFDVWNQSSYFTRSKITSGKIVPIQNTYLYRWKIPRNETSSYEIIRNLHRHILMNQFIRSIYLINFKYLTNLFFHRCPLRWYIYDKMHILKKEIFQWNWRTKKSEKIYFTFCDVPDGRWTVLGLKSTSFIQVEHTWKVQKLTGLGDPAFHFN